MNANHRRLLGYALSFSGFFLLNRYSETLAMLFFALFLILFSLRRIQQIGLKPRYIATLIFGGFLIFYAFVMDTPGPVGLLYCMIAFNLSIILSLYLFFRPRLQTEGSHKGAKIIIALTLTFVLLVDLTAAYILTQGTI